MPKKLRKCRKNSCKRSRNSLLHGAERVNPSKSSPTIRNGKIILAQFKVKVLVGNHRVRYADTIKLPNTARQLSQGTMHFECLQLDDQLVSSSSMPGQLKLKTGWPSSFTTIKCTANDLLFFSQPQARMKTPAVPPRSSAP